jgi:hypothetical protein
MPFSEAFASDDGLVQAWVVAAGEMEGHEYDWQELKWRDKR